MSTKSVTLSSGAVVRVKPISARLLEQYDKYHKIPEPPMREADVIGGGKELVPDLDNPEYQKALAQYNAKASNDLMNMLVSFGMEVTMPEDTKWLVKLQRAGIEVADDDLESAYIQLVLMEDFISDLKSVAREILSMSGVTEEVIQSWQELF